MEGIVIIWKHLSKRHHYPTHASFRFKNSISAYVVHKVRQANAAFHTIGDFCRLTSFASIIRRFAMFFNMLKEVFGGDLMLKEVFGGDLFPLDR